MATQRTVISSDGHVYEPPDLWTGRLDKPLRDQAPTLVHEDDGDWWYCQGQRLRSSPASASQPGKRFLRPEELSRVDRFDNVRRGAFMPGERLSDMDLDGISGDVLYPTVGLALYLGVEDHRLLAALFSTYNDWLAAYCHASPSRLKGIGMIGVDEVEEAVTELKRIAKIGLAGVLIPVFPPIGRSYDRVEYEPLWAAAQDLGLPISLHIGTNRLDPLAAPLITKNAGFFSNVDFWVRSSLAAMIFAGVFERYPGLRVGSVEHEIGWAPHFVERMDYTYTQRVPSLSPLRFRNGKLPSEFFRENVFCSFQDDPLGVRDRHLIGLDGLTWGWDYPHAEATFPRSQQVLATIFRDVPDDETALMVAGNTARLYHFE